MLQLTSQDREEIQAQIVKYKNEHIDLPISPTGQNEDSSLNQALKDGSMPNKKESKRIKRKIRGLWNNWRTTTLDAKSLEVEKIACEIAIQRAETKAKLNKIRREQEIAQTEHCLKLNEGNLQDIKYNTKSKPNMFWYGINRCLYHIARTTDNVPKILKNLLGFGVIILAIVLLKKFNVL